MTSAYVRNLIGLPVSDDDLQEIPYPAAELGLHVTSRCLQVGALLGLAAAPAAWCLGQSAPQDGGGRLRQAAAYGSVGAKLGCCAGPLTTAVLVRTRTRDQVYDLCYRLRCNRNQLHHERIAWLAAAAGAWHSGANGAICGVAAAPLLGVVFSRCLLPAVSSLLSTPASSN